MIAPEAQFRHHPPPPHKPNLKAWWNQWAFIHKPLPKREPFQDPYRELDTADHPVFGKPLKESLRYASVQISTANANGDLYVWGYIPVVVAKCGLYLKEHATEVRGTFRVSGSTRRMRDLQEAFESPPRYGKSLDWKQESYTTHDVASVFRRYLTKMPEPVIPYDMYHLFRDAMSKEPLNQEEVISTYKSLIRRMPRANQYLLLYVLDLLSVFARKCDKNLMTATNLALIFRPGIISHPQHEMSPQEHQLSQKVLEFLIAQQDWFMLDISPPPGVTTGEDHDETGGAGGGGNNPRFPAQGTTKWREGTSTPGPSRQGTGASAGGPPPGDGHGAYFNAEAGPSTTVAATTRQRVVSGGPVGAWYAPPSLSNSQLQPVRHNSQPDVRHDQTQIREHLPTHSNSLPPSPAKVMASFQSHPPTAFAGPSAISSSAPIYARFAQSSGEAPPSSPVRGVMMPRSESPMGYNQGSVSEPGHGQGHARDSSSSSGSLPLHPLSASTSTPFPLDPPHAQSTHPFFHHPPLPPSPSSPLDSGSGSSEIDDVMVIPSSDEEASYLGGGGWRLVSRGYAVGSGAGGSGGRQGKGPSHGGGGFISLGPGKKEKEREREQERERAEKERIRTMRRRTAMDRSELLATDMSPIQETSDNASNTADPATIGVSRSRTLPLRARKGSVGAADEKENSATNAMNITNIWPTETWTTGSKERLKGSMRERGEKRVLKKQRRTSGPMTGAVGPGEQSSRTLLP